MRYPDVLPKYLLMIYRVIYISICCLLLSLPLTGQDTTTVAPAVIQDSLTAAIDSAINTESTWPVPKRALLWAIIPSGGQIYNRDWWKVPLVVGGFYALYRTVDYNTDLYVRLKNAYLLKLANKEHEFSDTSIDNPNTLRNLRDRYDKNTQLSYVFLVLGYALQGIEAYVDAHLRQFDINDDLSMRLKPTLELVPISGQPVVGIGLTIPIR